MSADPGSGHDGPERAGADGAIPNGAIPGGAIPDGAALVRDPHPGILRGSLHLGYDLAWVVAAILLSPWLVYRSLKSRAFGRMVLERLGIGLGAVPPRSSHGGRPRLLVHGVSVGEVKGAQPLVRALERAYPGFDIWISTTTDTGTQVARSVFDPERVVRFPADISLLVNRFLRLVDPALVILIELEVWPNFLRSCNRRGVPVAVVNGRITDKSHGQYRIFRRLLPQFDRISLFCVQSEEYAVRFGGLGVSPGRVLVTGNVKADGLAVGAAKAGEELARLLGGHEGQIVVVAGSTHEPEERWVFEAWRAGAPDARLILVPRHPDRCDAVAEELAGFGVRPQRLTALRAGTEAPDPSRPVLVDTIGELEGVYALADVVFVGGTLVDHGGQNMLEPAAQGRAVVFGPSVTNFTQEAGLLDSSEACVRVANPDELGVALGELATDPDRRARMASRAMEAVESQKGATLVTVGALDELALGRLARQALEGSGSDDTIQESR